MKRALPYGQAILATTFFSVLLITLTHAGAGDLDLQAELIWGTNGDKPNDPRLKEIDPKTAKKLAGIFKWKNYFEVGRTNFTVAVGATRKVTMSPKCDVKVQNLGGSKVEVELIGEGKKLVQKRQAIKAGELVVLAGPDKNDTAWFVILHQHER